LASVKVWPQNRGNVGKHSDASTWFISHVLDARLGLVAARAHLVVGDRRHRHVVAVEAHRGDVALVDVDEVLVDPAVGLRAVGVEGLLVLAAADVLHVPMPRRSTWGRARGSARAARSPTRAGLDHVVVDAHDGGQLPARLAGGRGVRGEGHAGELHPNLTGCQKR
jgi:hypothetical protein